MIVGNVSDDAVLAEIASRKNNILSPLPAGTVTESDFSGETASDGSEQDAYDTKPDGTRVERNSIIISDTNELAQQYADCTYHVDAHEYQAYAMTYDLTVQQSSSMQFHDFVKGFLKKASLLPFARPGFAESGVGPEWCHPAQSHKTSDERC